MGWRNRDGERRRRFAARWKRRRKERSADGPRQPAHESEGQDQQCTRQHRRWSGVVAARKFVTRSSVVGRQTVLLSGPLFLIADPLILTLGAGKTAKTPSRRSKRVYACVNSD